ncbi:MAG TPA: FecR family protein [Bacteroidales bacterium]|nr:FecR family protein [Bacteroidales bacterium]HPT20366.1 FecR family protein [Bacteroidales bacterium]
MQDKKVKIDIEVLKRYLEGNFSREDESKVRSWFTQTESDDDLEENSGMIWDGISPDKNIPGYKESEILDRIHHKIRLDEKLYANETSQRFVFLKYLTKIAALLFIPLLVASLFLYFQNNTFRNSASYAEIYSPFGSRTNFYLPDGSTGVLNGGSSLKFPTQFTGKLRNVTLKGEAYFKVTPDHEKPFIVSTKNISVKVYGTTFNVMAYDDQQITEVTLESGQVEVLKNQDKCLKSIGFLKPEEQCIYSFLSDSSEIRAVNSAEKLSWLEGKLSFKYESFEDVVRKINQWYNVNIEIKDEVLNTYIYYGTFKDETLDEVLKLLQYTAPIRYRDVERKRNQDGTFEKRKIEIYYKKTE